jgi:predicted transcriptional regulator
MRKKRQNLLDRLADASEDLFNKMERALDRIEYSEELEGIDRGLRDAANHRLATKAQVRETFANFRRSTPKTR